VLVAEADVVVEDAVVEDVVDRKLDYHPSNDRVDTLRTRNEHGKSF